MTYLDEDPLYWGRVAEEEFDMDIEFHDGVATRASLDRWPWDEETDR